VQERRLPRPPSELNGHLHQLPALLLLDRLPTPMLGVGRRGDITYANPACVELLGYLDADAMTHLHLPDLLAGHDGLEPGECLETLRNSEGLVGWNHAQDYVIRTMVSPPLIVRDSDPMLLVSITDVTDWLWESKPVASVQRTNGHGP
jgi:PAS domain-containing protein